MKTPTTPHTEAADTAKTPTSKSTKKSTKSRAKATKSESASSNSSKNASGNATTPTSASLANQQQQHQGNSSSGQANLIATPTTPTSSQPGGSAVGVNMFESSLAQIGSSGGNGGGGVSGSNQIALGAVSNGSGVVVGVAGGSSSEITTARNHHKSYAGLEPRSVKIIWEQHDQSDVELSAEVCSRVAEDASYKLWELINNIKTYSRHSGGKITYDLVNEVLRDSDVPPCLGAMDSDWDRIDYDGSYFFYSDKILELRDEYQKDASFTIPNGPDFKCSWPVEDKHVQDIKKYVPSLIYVALNGNLDEVDTILADCAYSPIIGSSYRLILTKIIQLIAFKQSNDRSSRCWRLLKALASNPQARDVDCREEYFHLAEILICQLLAPYESIKVQNNTTIKSEVPAGEEEQRIKLEMECKFDTSFIEQQTATASTHDQSIEVEASPPKNEQILKLEPDNDEETVCMADGSPANMQASQYFASPVDWDLVPELCSTIGMLAAINGYFQSECLYHIIRRLNRFFDGRCINTERDYNYISRSVRGLIALGEYAFREFIPFIYKLKVDELPETLWNDFALAAVFIERADDIFLYEWLDAVCGADKLQPYMTYYAQYYENFLIYRYVKRKQATFKLNPKLGVRRLEWSAVAAAMCHGDDPNNALKPKPSLSEMFPELKPVNMNLNRAGNIRFKFAGCRPVIIKPKNKGDAAGTDGDQASNGSASSDVLIAKRRLFKPLMNERRRMRLSSYYFLRI